MTPADFPSFEAFFVAVNRGRESFPWQRRLAARVADGGWPDSIGIPTGMGKTSCIDIAVWALARQAALRGAARAAPTRIWYVVNRRLLIDAAFERAQLLAQLLADPGQLRVSWPTASDDDVAALRAVSEALRDAAALGVERRPLYVVRLRGGAELGRRPPDPTQPSLILATAPMFASRLLFRGYGSSTSMRPVDAALAGTDSLVLLDEAHLARPLMRLAGLVTECDLGDSGRLLPGVRAASRLVALTASGDETGDTFDLDDDDRRHPVMHERLMATKPVELVATTRNQLPSVLAAQARRLVSSRPGSGCVVFCNTVATARAVQSALGRALRQAEVAADVVLITGRIREHEAGHVRDLLLDQERGAPADRDPASIRPRALVVVSTQTLEVGADLDFDFLVTETAGARALTQRLGRLNRLGARPHAKAVICHPEDAQTQAPYGREPSVVWNRLRSAGQQLDLAPAQITQVLGPPEDTPPRVAELLPDHVWEFAKTSFSEPDEPAVELFFEGFEPDAEVSVCWRAYLPPDGAKVVPPLREEEAIEVPLRELVQSLPSQGVRRLAADRSTLERVLPDALRAGDTVVLPVDAGLYDQGGWNPDERTPVLDVAPLRAGILYLDRKVLRNLVRDDLPEEVDEILQSLTMADEPEAPPSLDGDRDLVDRLLGLLGAVEPHPWITSEAWQQYLNRLRDGRVVRDVEGLPPYLEARRPRSVAGRVRIQAEAFEELSFDASSVALVQHLGSVGEVARRIATKLGLPDPIVASLERAGWYHDLGKYDPRFQRWLDPNAVATEPVAKSAASLDQVQSDRVASGWPRGGRHELLSVRLLTSYLTNRGPGDCDPDLVLHLVASHHGHGRPWIGLAVDEAPPTVSARIDGSWVTVGGDLSEPDWAQPRRFRTLCQRYGVWGLALLEAVLRQSDHAASSALEVV